MKSFKNATYRVTVVTNGAKYIAIARTDRFECQAQSVINGRTERRTPNGAISVYIVH